MEKYSLGPNGGIVTALNLFTTKFDQVLDLLKKCDAELAVFDTPGQIEVFTWSVSGNIICETLAASFPTVVVYVVDTVRSVSPVTFMSNMLYACSILYKTRLPFIVALNKVSFYMIYQESTHYAIQRWHVLFTKLKVEPVNDCSMVNNTHGHCENFEKHEKAYLLTVCTLIINFGKV